ncbi:hypothetical protein ACFYSI_12820 [Staphylococcus xylosus]|uniref:hypothetical protein n=1 Tax=Staphylococcus xylosus TaxID=1288 RepID=UPI003687DEF5
MNQSKELDVREIYYTLSFLYERTTDRFRSEVDESLMLIKKRKKEAVNDLDNYLEQIIKNLYHLPDVWREVYKNNQHLSYEQMAKLMIESCHPITGKELSN